MFRKMKNLIRVLTVLAFAFAAQTASAGFQNTSWGDSPERVIARQGINEADLHWIDGDVHDENVGPFGYLFAKAKIIEEDVLVMYVFVDEKLVRVKVVFTQRRTSENRYLADYDTIERKLSRLYGKPVMVDTHWQDDRYRDKPEKWGMALVVGDLAKYTQRDAPGTEIWHTLSGGNYEVRHVLEYVSKAFYDLEDAAQSAREAEEL